MYFNLKEPNSNKDTLIILRYFISKKEGRFVFSTGLTISPKDWDKNNKMAKATRGRSDLSQINRKLQSYTNFLEKTLTYFDLNNISTNKESLKSKFIQEFKPQLTNDKFIYFTDFVDFFIDESPKLTNRSTKRKYSLTKIKHYKKTNNRLKEFELFTKSRIRIDSFTIFVYDKLIDYLKNDRGYAINTVGDLIKNIKKFLKVAEFEFQYDVHKDYKDDAFSVLKEESLSVALNEDEIERIFQHDFSNNNKLQNCRDLAIIGLWTGLRVSDFLSLDKIKPNEKFITVQPQKTKNSSGIKVVIPLHHNIKEIIEKRGMPRMISDVKFNEYIKEVCLEVGITNLVKGALMVKDEAINKYRKKVGLYPKYKLISSHTCRRSFATNLYKMDFPTLSIMNITGHKTEKSFLTYIKVTPTEHAEKLLRHWEEYYKK